MIESLTKAVVGADPGVKGAFFLITEARETQLFEFQNISRHEWRNWLDNVWLVHNILAVGIEKVGAMPGQGVASMFNFGNSAGYLEGLCDANYLPVEFVMPGVWQKFHRLGGKSGPLGCTPSQEKTARKNRHKRCAEEKFPNHKVNKENADVMLLADYVWHQHFKEVEYEVPTGGITVRGGTYITWRGNRRNK